MNPEAMLEFLRTVEAEVQSRPTPTEFEMAYQARIAIERIRFAIKHSEQFAPHTDQMRESGLQLLDALERLGAVDRRFQERSRVHSALSRRSPEGSNGRSRTSTSSAKPEP
jgi:hypothetical protein